MCAPGLRCLFANHFSCNYFSTSNLLVLFLTFVGCMHTSTSIHCRHLYEFLFGYYFDNVDHFFLLFITFIFLNMDQPLIIWIIVV